jgi:hypothetical protein
MDDTHDATMLPHFVFIYIDLHLLREQRRLAWSRRDCWKDSEYSVVIQTGFHIHITRRTCKALSHSLPDAICDLANDEIHGAVGVGTCRASADRRHGWLLLWSGRVGARHAGSDHFRVPNNQFVYTVHPSPRRQQGVIMSFVVE